MLIRFTTLAFVVVVSATSANAQETVPAPPAPPSPPAAPNPPLPPPTAAVQARLWDGSISGDTAAIRQAVNDGARVHSLDTRTNQNGRHALNWAAWHNRVEAVKLLLALGAPIEAENITGFTALHHAAENGSLEVARILLVAGADPEHPNGAGRKPAETAREHGHIEVAGLIEAAVRKRK